MRQRRGFRPSALGHDGAGLEDRMVLSGGFRGVQSVPVQLQGMYAPVRAFRPGRPAAVSSLVDVAFQSFQDEYQAVRNTYLASVRDGTATQKDTDAFKSYTTQRVNLLAQQVVNSMLTYGQSTRRGHRTDSPLPLIQQRLITSNDNRATPRSGPTLAKNLEDSTPAYNASPTSIALAIAAQDNAIQAARVSTQSLVTVVRNGNFGNARG